ncbi:unnamed protein product [Soboliphyme baturini]|uniref:Uncharacterized protein n=1 Tax=Soboliphyme baturini TaxID=241478 RepID=A0A183INF7_9BILA|nr:unnamed protein product [Soboliphyme baturini]
METGFHLLQKFDPRRYCKMHSAQNAECLTDYGEDAFRECPTEFLTADADTIGFFIAKFVKE